MTQSERSSVDPADPASDELRVFVAQTLNAIMSGVSDVQSEAIGASAYGTGTFAFGPPREVAFDIAVTARRTGSVKGGLKLEVFSVGANLAGNNARENSTVSRIAFTIPAHYRKTKDV